MKYGLVWRGIVILGFGLMASACNDVPAGDPVTNLEEINVTVKVKGSVQSQVKGDSDSMPSEATKPKHGDVEYYKIGNEVPAFTYTSKDCFVGTDSFIYQIDDNYGKVNTNIKAGVELNEVNVSNIIFANDSFRRGLMAYDEKIDIKITTQPSHGRATLSHGDDGKWYYTYVITESGYIGSDYFVYTMSSNFNGCTYTKTGKISFDIKAAANGYDHNLSQIVIVGDKMWEHTSHAIPNISQDRILMNGQTYSEADQYCKGLELGGFDDWRIPHADWDNGYTRANNELLNIRRQPLDKDGNVWYYKYDDTTNTDNYDQIDENSTGIIEPFGTMSQNASSAYWTNDTQGGNMENAHVAVFFSNDIYNVDGFGDDYNLSVRCVRDIENGDAPLVVDAGQDREILGNGSLVLSSQIKTDNANNYTYQWRYGKDIVSDDESFTFATHTGGTNVIVLKVTDSDGNIAWDVVHLPITTQ